MFVCLFPCPSRWGVSTANISFCGCVVNHKRKRNSILQGSWKVCCVVEFCKDFLRLFHISLLYQNIFTMLVRHAHTVCDMCAHEDQHGIVCFLGTVDYLHCGLLLTSLNCHICTACTTRGACAVLVAKLPLSMRKNCQRHLMFTCCVL